MRPSFLATVVCACVAGSVAASNNWAGSNVSSTYPIFLCLHSNISSFSCSQNYYIPSLPDGDRAKMLDGMKDAGMKVLRTWISGHDAGQKGSSNAKTPDVESSKLGQYDDTILKQIDQLMVEAHDRGIKLLIGEWDSVVGGGMTKS